MMTVTSADTAPSVIELTPAEAWADFDAKTRGMLGLSAEEFLRRLDAGGYNSSNVNDDVSFLITVGEIVRDLPHAQAGD